jgi:coenzyme F420-reducing hydrogenase beta subunit
VGDAWLPELRGQDGWNLLITRTELGKTILDDAHAAGRMDIFPIEASKVEQAQRLMLFDRKHTVFPLMKLTRLLSAF